MTMAPSATFSTLIGICQELNGLSFGTPRFSGACDPVQNYTTGGAGDASAPLAWGFQSFTVDSLSDLDAMRNLLGGSVLYFERSVVMTHPSAQSTLWASLRFFFFWASLRGHLTVEGPSASPLPGLLRRITILPKFLAHTLP